MVATARRAAALLREEGLAVGVVNCRFVKPMDQDLLRRLAASHRLLVTLEENSLRGGFGTGVYETMHEMDLHGPRLIHLGLPDRFIDHGSREALLREIGLAPDQIAARVRQALVAGTAAGEGR